MNSNLTALPLLFTAAVFLLAGGVKGIVGLGLPTVSMALLALRMAPAEAAALLIVPSLVTNLWQIRPWAARMPMLRRLARMQIGVAVGTLGGAWLLGAPSGAWARASLGAALIVYAAWGLAGLHLHVRSAHEAWLSPLIGAATGWVTSATGVFVMPAVPYLQGLGFNRDELIQAMGLSFTVSTLSLAVGLAANASVSAVDVGVSLLMLLPALVGMSAGQRLRQRLSPSLFRRCFLVSLVLLGAHMIGREVWTA